MAQPSRFSCAVLAMLLAPVSGFSDEHLVSSADIQARFGAVATERAENVRTLQVALSRPVVVDAAAVARVDLGRLRAGVPYLTDQELQELAARSQSLEVDPAAGMNPVILVLAVIGVVFLLALIFAVISCASGYCGD